MVQMFSQFGITEVGNGSGSWEGNDYTYNYRTEWNEGYLEEFEAISVESLILLLKTKNINDFTQDDFGSLGLGTLRDGNTTYENFKWAPDVNKKDIIDAPDEEELCGDGDKQDSEYEWASPERIEFVVTEDDKEDLNFILINQANSRTTLDDSEEVDISDIEYGITKFSFINNKGEVKFEIECDDIMEFDGEVAIVLKNSNWGLINNTGYLLVDFGEYHYINEFNQGYSKVSKGDDSDLRDGLINVKGELVIECKYIIKSFSEGLVPFANNKQGLWGYMDLTQNIVINNMFDDAEVFCEGLAAVCKNSKWGFIDKKGVMVIDFIYDEARSFCSGLSRVKLNAKIGYINNKGRNITGYIYDNGYNFTNNYAIVSKDEENWGMINTSGKEIIICAYDEIQPMSEGLVTAKLGDYWGYLNEMGETVILFKYDSAGCFSEGLASVEIDGKSGYIDRAGRVKIDFLYKIASEFKNGLAKVEYLIDDETIETSSNSSFQKNDNYQFFTVTIGDKEWATTNLNVDTFRNGDQITQAKTNKEWEKAGEDKKPAWCYYENKVKNGEKYGKLYNWYAVSDSRGLAPLGWEIPSYKEWNQLVEFLGGNLWGAGNKLKSDEGWREDENGNNESGFSGLPGGSRWDDGDFLDNLLSGYWWTSTECENDDEEESPTAWGATLDYSTEFLEIDEIDMGRGYSVRCIKK